MWSAFFLRWKRRLFLSLPMCAWEPQKEINKRNLTFIISRCRITSSWGKLSNTKKPPLTHSLAHICAVSFFYQSKVDVARAIKRSTNSLGAPRCNFIKAECNSIPDSIAHLCHFPSRRDGIQRLGCVNAIRESRLTFAFRLAPFFICARTPHTPYKFRVNPAIRIRVCQGEREREKGEAGREREEKKYIYTTCLISWTLNYN